MNKQKSFTLIELLVVIVIIGILAGVIMISTSSSIDKANLAKAQAFSSTIQNSMLSNLVSEWLFDSDAVGNKTEDSWGNNDGIIYGVDYNSRNTGKCVFGGCYSFISANLDYINISMSTVFNQTTISVWVNPLIETNQQAISSLYWFGTGHTGYSIRVAKTPSATLYFQPSGNITLTGKEISMNEWHSLVLTFNSSNTKFYVDGFLTYSQNASIIFTAPENSPCTNIGRYTLQSNNYLDGLVDDVRIYNTVLSSSQIKQNYIAGLDSLLSKGSISKEDYNQRINELAYEK